MHTLILLTGKQGSGKSTLFSLMRNAKELLSTFRWAELKKQILLESSFYETIVVTQQDLSIIDNFLKDICKEQGWKFLTYEI